MAPLTIRLGGGAWCVRRPLHDAMSRSWSPKQLSNIHKRMQTTLSNLEAEESSNDSHDAEPRQSTERSMNRVTLLGRVGDTPSRRGNESSSVVVFPLATNNAVGQANGEYETRTMWHSIVVTKPSLQNYVTSYIRKGGRVLITGSIKYDTYVDRDNVKRKSTSVVAQDIISTSPRTSGSGLDDNDEQ